MKFDLIQIPPTTRAALIALGRRFGSSDTLGQAEQTLSGLETHGDKLTDWGFNADDAAELRDARDALLAAGVGRDTKRTDKKATNRAYPDVLRKGKTIRSRARSVLRGARRILALSVAPASDDAVRTIDTVLEHTGTTSDDAIVMASQLDNLRQVLSIAVVAEAAKDRGGPKAVTDLTANATALRAVSQDTATVRGTPEETDQLDLVDGIIIGLTRQAREAADSAAKALGEPAIVAAFELSQLYGSGRAKKKEPPKAEEGSEEAPR